MRKIIINILLLAGIFFFVNLYSGCSDKNGNKTGQQPEPESPSGSESEKPSYEVSEVVNPFSWIATDHPGNTIDPESDEYPDATERKNKFVGIFYFIWHGCHGYDTGANHNSVQSPAATDMKSPFNVQEIMTSNPSDPQWGPPVAMHHWGEPYLGYYVADDEWVIRKHAQMLTDAGVDVILFDVTNAYAYIPVVKKIADVYTTMRKEGCATPQFAFLLNSATANTFSTIYTNIYAKNLYEELWFMWLGKPLILANPDELAPAYKNMFTIRHSWYLWNNSGADTWFGDGTDKWPWGGLYPQQAGTHDGKNECVSVMPATHPVSNIGRSHDVNSGQPAIPRSGEGIYFKKQFEHAMELDPSFILFTGWNEWTAQRQVASQDSEAGFLGRTVKKGDTYFVDQFDHEFSRDIEPLNGDFGDNYYYMLVDFIRKFKGTGKLPVFHQAKNIAIDGNLSDWADVQAVYGDDKGDTAHRNHFGWGRIGRLTNVSGRNDIMLTKITTDGTYLYFYVKTAGDISSCEDKDWMRLFIQVKSNDVSWEGFHFVVNRTVKDEKETSLEKSKGGWNWEEVTTLNYRVSKNEMELSVPLSKLGITTPDAFSVDFKWIDNAASDGDIQTCMRDGDSAPNGRFRYRYTYKKNRINSVMSDEMM
jgi:hypothetical protein